MLPNSILMCIKSQPCMRGFHKGCSISNCTISMFCGTLELVSFPLSALNAVLASPLGLNTVQVNTHHERSITFFKIHAIIQCR